MTLLCFVTAIRDVMNGLHYSHSTDEDSSFRCSFCSPLVTIGPLPALSEVTEEVTDIDIVEKRKG